MCNAATFKPYVFPVYVNVVLGLQVKLHTLLIVLKFTPVFVSTQSILLV